MIPTANHTEQGAFFLSRQGFWRRRGSVWVGMLFGLGVGLFQRSATALTLTDAVAQALSNRPEVRGAFFNASAARERVGQAYAGFLPSIHLRVAQGPEGTHQLPSQRVPPGYVWTHREDRSISLNQNIFDGFRTANQVESTQAGSRASAWKTVETAENLAMRGVESYLTVLKNRAQLRESRQNLAATQKLLGLVQQRLAEGLGTQADVSQARSRVQRAEASMAQISGSLQMAESLFQSLFGAEPEGLEARFPALVPFASAEEALAIALAQHPAILAAQESLLEAQARERVQEGANTPAANLVLTASQVRDQGGNEGETNTQSAMLEVTFNLFSGHRDIHIQREAAFMAKQAEDSRAKVQLDVTERVANAYRSWQTTRSLVAIYAAQVESLRRVRGAYLEQFHLGKRTMLDLLDSESELFSAQSSLIGEQYQDYIEGYRVQFSVGRLLSALQIPVPDPLLPQTVDFAQTKQHLLESDVAWPGAIPSKPSPVEEDKEARAGQPLSLILPDKSVTGESSMPSETPLRVIRY